MCIPITHKVKGETEIHELTFTGNFKPAWLNVKIQSGKRWSPRFSRHAVKKKKTRTASDTENYTVLKHI